MLDALAMCIAKHPFLRARISGTGPLSRNKIDNNIRLGADKNPLSFSTMDEELSLRDIAHSVLRSSSECKAGDFEDAWRASFDSALNEWEMEVATGPLWQVSWISCPKCDGSYQHAMVFLFNHAISDQTSAHTLIRDLSTSLKIAHEGRVRAVEVVEGAPPSVEEAVLGVSHEASPNVLRVLPGCGFSTLQYSLLQVWHSLQGAPLLSPRVSLLSASARRRKGYGFRNRNTRVEFEVLDAGLVKELVARCRREGTTVTGALVAAVWRAAARSIETPSEKVDKLRVLMSLDMRRFGQGEGDWTQATMACAGGATDFVLRANPETSAWDLAREARARITDFIESPWLPQESVRLFDVGSRMLDMVQIVKSEGRDNLNTLGRAYSVGVSNAGLFSKGPSAPADRWAVRNVYYGTSHTHTGCLFQLSAVTVEGSLCLTFQTPAPIVSEEEAKSFRSRTMAELMERISS
uniref:Phthiocerol/phthiodiolone dimycocerosyl transferase C-terminal domain-containing protein n=1 Tax=Pinguiococcus pyrenoidosus TaxID=172671 RepID=A0A7R9YF98_9STRA|mmetsp:Transcript_6817/g.26344  ORF Transcript_6817/g.26344 Transcript_6817/m.26344 type:complete len:464 (+) Transcript_6817:582-1973(+)